MHNKSVFKLVIGNIETSIDFKVGVKQGDSTTLVLFLFLMMAFAETLEDEWTATGSSKSQFSRKDNSPRSTRKLLSHRPVTFSYGTLFDILCMLYVDDNAFAFESRTDIKRGINILSDHFARFGLEMNIGTEKTPQILNAYYSHPQVSFTHKHYRSPNSPISP